MLRFEHGYQMAVSEVIESSITASMLSALVSQCFLDQFWLLYFKLLNMLGTILLILVVPYWGTGYLIEWLFGLWILSQRGLVGFWDFVFYFGIPLIVLIGRLCKKYFNYPSVL